jgi:hypothetical protein
VRGRALTRRPLAFAGTVVLAAALSAWSIFGALVGWRVCCGWLISIDFAIALSVGAALNVFGLLALVIRSRSWGASALGAVQVGNVLFALAASVAVSPAWLADTAPAVAILVLVLLFRRSWAGGPGPTV